MNDIASSATPLLQLTGINTFYGQAQAHFDLLIEVPRGHIVCLLGRQCQQQIDDDEDHPRPGAAALGRGDL